MNEILGLDISNYTGDVSGKLDCYHDAGVRRFIVGCWYASIAHMQIDAIKADGRFEFDGTYAYLEWGNGWAEKATNIAIGVALAHGLRRVWLDCENATGGQSASAIQAEIANCVTLVQNAGLNCGIYTGRYWWESATNNTPDFAHLPLWHASYWDDGHFQQEVDYGGWTKVTVHQYASTPELCGRKEDRDVWFEQEDEMTAQEQEELAALRKRRELAELVADLNKYDEMLLIYNWAVSKGLL